MRDDNATNSSALDPVVVEALKSITERVYHRRGPQIQQWLRRYHSMLDQHSRDSAISAFKQLKHRGYHFEPFQIHRWALDNGWKKNDAQILDDYAAGVLAGVRYHGSDPYGNAYIDNWIRDASDKEPWHDPGRRVTKGHFELK